MFLMPLITCDSHKIRAEENVSFSCQKYNIALFKRSCFPKLREKTPAAWKDLMNNLIIVGLVLLWFFGFFLSFGKQLL